MSTVEKWTLLIATISICVSMLTLGWTIYRDAIQKPRFRTSISISTIVHPGHGTEGPYIMLEALNLGPLSNRIGGAFVRKSWWKRHMNPRGSNAYIIPDHTHWANTVASSKIDVGDKATLIFPYDKECFLREDFAEVGVADGYGRIHWAPKKQLRDVREKFREKFPDAELIE